MTTFVYILSEGDHALYVGHTKDAERRIGEHRADTWGHRITRTHVEEYATKAEATQWERHYILDLEPDFNVHGNPAVACCDLCHPPTDRKAEASA